MNAKKFLKTAIIKYTKSQHWKNIKTFKKNTVDHAPYSKSVSLVTSSDNLRVTSHSDVSSQNWLNFDHFFRLVCRTGANTWLSCLPTQYLGGSKHYNWFMYNDPKHRCDGFDNYDCEINISFQYNSWINLIQINLHLTGLGWTWTISITICRLPQHSHIHKSHRNVCVIVYDNISYVLLRKTVTSNKYIGCFWINSVHHTYIHGQ